MLRSLIVAALACFPLSSQALGREVIAQTGDPAIGLAGDAAFDRFAVLGWTDDGALLFEAWTTRFADEPGGVWRWAGDGEISLVFAHGAETDYGSPIDVVVNRAGRLAFASMFVPPVACAPQQGYTDGLWIGALNEPPVALWKTGDPLPSGGHFGDYFGHLVASFGGLVLSETGSIAFGTGTFGEPCGFGGGDGLFHRDAVGVFRTVIDSGASIPGTADGSFVTGFEYVDQSLNESDQLAFVATINDDGEGDDHAMVRWDPDAGLALLDEGDWSLAVPPFPIQLIGSGARFGPPIIDANGRLFYVRQTFEEAILVESALFASDGVGAPQRLLGTGDVLPDPDQSVVANVFGSGAADLPLRAVGNGVGGVAFGVELYGSSADPETRDWALITIDANGELAVRARDRDPAPGSGGVFASIAKVVAYDEAGDVLALVTIDAGGASASHAEYLFGSDGSAQRLAPLPGLIGRESLDAALSRAAAVESWSSGERLYVADVPEPDAIAGGVASMALLAVAFARRAAGLSRWLPAP